MDARSSSEALELRAPSPTALAQRNGVERRYRFRLAHGHIVGAFGLRLRETMGVGRCHTSPLPPIFLRMMLAEPQVVTFRGQHLLQASPVLSSVLFVQ